MPVTQPLKQNARRADSHDEGAEEAVLIPRLHGCSTIKGTTNQTPPWTP